MKEMISGSQQEMQNYTWRKENMMLTLWKFSSTFGEFADLSRQLES